MSYFWQRSEMTDEGRVISVVPDYLAYLTTKSIADNPRLIDDTHRGKEHYVLNPNYRTAASDWRSADDYSEADGEAK